jgi:hypothetical protein
MGFAFWSKLDSVGQTAAAAFPDKTEAMRFAAEIVEPDHWHLLEFKDVVVDVDGTHASIAALKAAGLGDHLGDMEADALRYAEPAGHG